MNKLKIALVFSVATSILMTFVSYCLFKQKLEEQLIRKTLQKEIESTYLEMTLLKDELEITREEKTILRNELKEAIQKIAPQTP